MVVISDDLLTTTSSILCTGKNELPEADQASPSPTSQCSSNNSFDEPLKPIKLHNQITNAITLDTLHQQVVDQVRKERCTC